MSRTEAIERAISAIESRINLASDVRRPGLESLMALAIENDGKALKVLREMEKEEQAKEPVKAES